MGDGILAPGVAAYLASLVPNADKETDPVIARLEAEAERDGIPILSREGAAFLEVLVAATRPERVLEVGTAIGYSTIRMARRLPAWGNVETIELDVMTATRARRNLEEAGLRGRVTVHVGPALKVMATLTNRYDLVFIDAAKEEYAAYLDLALALMPSGAVVVADNLLWGGRAAEPGPREGDDPFYERAAQAIRAFNGRFVRHPALRATIVAVGDGLGVGVKL